MADNTTSDAEKQRREKLREEHPNAWIPLEIGDELNGEIVDVASAWSDVRGGGSSYPLLTVASDDGKEYQIHGFGAVLYREIMRLRPRIGEKISIRYLGPGEAKPGLNPPEIYRVRAQSSTRDVAAAEYDNIARAEQQSSGQAPLAV